jgi:hypothetical protein
MWWVQECGLKLLVTVPEEGLDMFLGVGAVPVTLLLLKFLSSSAGNKCSNWKH